jgi:hypothetical protein
LHDHDAITMPDGKRITLERIGRELWMQISDDGSFVAGRALSLQEIKALNEVFDGTPGSVTILIHDEDFLLIFGDQTHPVPIRLPRTDKGVTTT